jgi:hypothetical protein
VAKNTFRLIGAGSQAIEILDFAQKGSVEFFLSSAESEIGQMIKGIRVNDLLTFKSN